MKKSYTSKLFYRRYAFRILFTKCTTIGDPDYHKDWTVHNCKEWLESNHIEHRMYNKVRRTGRKNNPKTLVTVSSSLFLKNKLDFDHAVSKWKGNVDSVTCPYDESHVDILIDNTTVLIRKKLIYNRFRYIVVFRRKWQESIQDLEDWIVPTLIQQQDEGREIKWVSNSWTPRLYLSDESDLVLVKLSWGERIKCVTLVKTIDEIERSKTQKP